MNLPIRYLIFSMLALLSLFPRVYGQNLMYFKNYTTQDGLPAGTVTGIWNDARGFLWLLSENGLCRFDGYEFVSYRNNPSDINSLPSSTVLSGHSDMEGNTFFITSQAITKYVYKNESFHSLIPLSSGTDARLVHFHDKYTYILVEDRLYKVDFSAEMVKYFKIPVHQLPDARVNSMIYDDKLFMQAKGFTGYFDLSSETFHEVSLNDSPGDSLESIPLQSSYFFTKPDKQLYLSFPSHLFRYIPSQQQFTELPPRPSENSGLRGNTGFENKFNNYIFILAKSGEIEVCNLINGTSFTSDILVKMKDRFNGTIDCNGFAQISDNRIWVQSSNAGLMELSIVDDSLVLVNHFHTGNSDIPTNNCNLIHSNNDELTWFFNTVKGLVKCEKSNTLIRNYKTGITSHPSNITLSNNIRAICESASGELLTGTLDGAYNMKYHGDVIKPLKHPVTAAHIFDNNSFGTVTKDRHGTFWISSWNKPILYRLNFNERTFTEININTGNTPLTKSSIRCAYADPDDYLYLGSFSGSLYKILTSEENARLEKVSLVRKKKHSKDPAIFCISSFTKGNLLVGTSQGIFVYNKATSGLYLLNAEIPLLSSDVRSIYYTDPENIWIGTNGNGLLQYNPVNKTLRQYTKENGLSDNSVYSLLADNKKNIWMGTNRGVCRLTPSTGAFLTFSEKDGIQFEEFNTNAACLLSDGRLAFGGVNGIILFHPDTILVNKKSPEPLLLKILANNAPVALDTSFTFGYNENYLTFQFAALDLFRNEEIQYAYTLEGLDKHWTYCGKRRFTTYANLQPGSYLFKVKCTDPHGEWSRNILTIPITILTPWYKSWYFFLSIALLCAGLIYAWIRYKNKQNERVLKIRENIARDLHDEIGSNLSSISIFNQVAKESVTKNGKDIIPILDKIGEYAQISQEAMGDIVWMITTKNDTFENILTKMQGYATENIGHSSIRLFINFDEKMKHLKIGMKQRKNLYLIFKESINNILKYAQCKNIWIDLYQNNNIVTLQIKDDGKGFDMNTTGGNGLINMKKRAEEIKGLLSIDSAPGKGTGIKLMFDL